MRPNVRPYTHMKAAMERAAAAAPSAPQSVTQPVRTAPMMPPEYAPVVGSRGGTATFPNGEVVALPPGSRVIHHGRAIYVLQADGNLVVHAQGKGVVTLPPLVLAEARNLFSGGQR